MEQKRGMDGWMGRGGISGGWECFFIGCSLIGPCNMMSSSESGRTHADPGLHVCSGGRAQAKQADGRTVQCLVTLLERKWKRTEALEPQLR